uniref:Uncharacterized protein n=1 Tax=Anguilla anguilla TaxID=7936 RepID=A0A0E9XRQ5_ANGAN
MLGYKYYSQSTAAGARPIKSSKLRPILKTSTKLPIGGDTAHGFILFLHVKAFELLGF